MITRNPAYRRCWDVTFFLSSNAFWTQIGFEASTVLQTFAKTQTWVESEPIAFLDVFADGETFHFVFSF
jgi:hypothetical protein